MLNLKDKLEHIQLSDAQKTRIKTNVKNRTKKSRSFVPIVLSAFVILSIFLIILSLGPSSDSTNILSESKAAANEIKISEIHLPKPVILWSIMNSILVLMTYYFFKRSLQSVTRWQHDERMQEWHAFFSRPILSKLLLFFCLGLLWIGVILFSNTLWFVQTCFTILLIIFIIIWEFYSVRDKQWSKCPHCEKNITRMQIFRKSFVPFRERCDFCNELIYVNPKENQNKMIIYIFPFTSMGYHTLFDLHLFLVVFFAVGSFLSLCYFVLPYIITFSEKDEQLW